MATGRRSPVHLDRGFWGRGPFAAFREFYNQAEVGESHIGSASPSEHESTKVSLIMSRRLDHVIEQRRFTEIETLISAEICSIGSQHDFGE